VSKPEGPEKRLIPRSGSIDATVSLPPSKSLTQRALIAAAMAGGESTLSQPLVAGDSQVLSTALTELGIPVRASATRWKVEGCGGRLPSSGAQLDLENAGTAMRFLTPLVATGHGTFVLDGSARMRSRPMTDLLDALAALGVAARSMSGNGCPPIEIRASGLPGGIVGVRGNVSSQFLSGLLLASPCAGSPMTLELTGRLVSSPYVDLTVDLMKRFGVEFDLDGPERYRVRSAAAYSARSYTVEGDASSACWWMAAAAITGGRIRIEGITRKSRQGDLRFMDLMEEMGCRCRWDRSAGGEDGIIMEGGSLHGIDADLGDMPDTAPALGAVALFASSPTRIHGAPHLRDKESDRIAGLASGLGALGARTEEHRDGLTIRPGRLRGCALDPLDDHRLAMAFSVAGLGIGGVEILNPGCVAKSYPDFFKTLEKVVDTAQ
jgi:3-phosphoshikimate 1-carboxyvinyltransferase